MGNSGGGLLHFELVGHETIPVVESFAKIRPPATPRFERVSFVMRICVEPLQMLDGGGPSYGGAS